MKKYLDLLSPRYTNVQRGLAISKVRYTHTSARSTLNDKLPTNNVFEPVSEEAGVFGCIRSKINRSHKGSKLIWAKENINIC